MNHAIKILFFLLALASITTGQETSLSGDDSARREIRAFCVRAGKHLARNDIGSLAGMIPSDTVIALKDGTVMTAVQAKSFALAMFPGIRIQRGSCSTGTINVQNGKASAAIKSSCRFLPDNTQKTGAYQASSTWKVSFEQINGKWVPKRFDQNSFSMTQNGKPVSMMPMPSMQ